MTDNMYLIAGLSSMGLRTAEKAADVIEEQDKRIAELEAKLAEAEKRQEQLIPAAKVTRRWKYDGHGFGGVPTDDVSLIPTIDNLKAGDVLYLIPEAQREGKG